MTNLDSILKSRDITSATKVYLVKAMFFFPVVMYGCESWTIKKAEHQRIDAFEMWCWRGLLRAPWTTRRSNQSILKEISTEYSLEKTDAEAPILWVPEVKICLIRKTLLGRIEDMKRMTEEMIRWHHQPLGHEFE